MMAMKIYVNGDALELLQEFIALATGPDAWEVAYGMGYVESYAETLRTRAKSLQKAVREAEWEERR